MSQVETQTRPQNGRQQANSPVANGEQRQQRGPKRQGSGNRQFDDRRGGDRPVGRGRGGPRGDKPFNNKDSKSIYIGKVFTDDLDGSTISEKLKEQRIKYLREIMESFGAVESFDAPVGEGYVLLSYDSHQSADNALKTLRNVDEVESITLRIKDKLNNNKLPAAVAPNLRAYRYSWSDKQPATRNVRTGGKNVAQLPKTVVASTKKTTDQTSSPATPQPTQSSTQPAAKQDKPKKERKPKAQEEQKPVEPQQTEQQPQQQKPKQKKQEAVQQAVVSPKTQQGADDLQREAERARLSQDLVYLKQQQQHVSQELSAESDRCRARDERINRLSEELNRVRQQEQFLEGQLKAEQKWKTDADERISKLTEEINHFTQEEKQVEKRLRAVEQQLGANGH